MPRRVFITGITGFVGSHLTEYLLSGAAGHLEIHGTGRPGPQPFLARIQDHPGLKLHRVALEDTPALAALLDDVRPDYIFHLAALSYAGLSITNPGLTLNTNINLALSLFEAVRAANLSATALILNTGSGDQYGLLEPADLPVREQAPFRPGNPYAVSKIAQEMLGYQYFRSYKLHIINTRAFNHLGPRLSPELAAGTFAQQIALIESGRAAPVIKVGNLDSRRDYTDVRDIVRAYWLALNPPEGQAGCRPGEAYNICSGVDHSMREMLGQLIKLARCKVQVEPDPARLRPSDVPVICGSFAKFRQATGWKPAIPFEQSLLDLLDYWRGQVEQDYASA